jgi:anti-sigma regulatory factor (Ser/Thr protein kinase)
MEEYRAQFLGTPASVRDARLAIAGYAARCGFDDDTVHDIALAAGEALANAVEHGNKERGVIDVGCSFSNGELCVALGDGGAGFDLERAAEHARDPNSIRGFGIFIMRSVMDCVEFEASGAVVRLSKRLPSTRNG